MPLRTALLSLGANLGRREQSILRAAELIQEYTQAETIRLSGFIETEPVGYEDQPKFINCAVRFETALSAGELLGICKRIESELGRQTRPRWHEREIDIDVILLGDEIVEKDDCCIPHPRMHERMFVLAPASEIAPEMVHPILRKTVSELLEELASKSESQKPETAK